MQQRVWLVINNPLSPRLYSPAFHPHYLQAYCIIIMCVGMSYIAVFRINQTTQKSQKHVVPYKLQDTFYFFFFNQLFKQKTIQCEIAPFCPMYISKVSNTTATLMIRGEWHPQNGIRDRSQTHNCCSVQDLPRTLAVS